MQLSKEHYRYARKTNQKGWAVRTENSATRDNCSASLTSLAMLNGYMYPRNWTNNHETLLYTPYNNVPDNGR